MKLKRFMYFLFIFIISGCRALVYIDIRGGDYEVPYTGVDIMGSGKVYLIFEKRIELEPFQGIGIKEILLSYRAKSDLKTYGEVRVTSQGTADSINMFLEADVPSYLKFLIDQFASLLGYNTNVPDYVKNAPVVYSDTIYGEKVVNEKECREESFSEIVKSVEQGYIYIIVKTEVDLNELKKIPSGEIHNIYIEGLEIEIEADKGFEKTGSFIELVF